jgi:hypothetical protein
MFMKLLRYQGYLDREQLDKILRMKFNEHRRTMLHKQLVINGYLSQEQVLRSIRAFFLHEVCLFIFSYHDICSWFVFSVLIIT